MALAATITATMSMSNTVADNFDDSLVDPLLWKTGTLGLPTAREQNQRLELFIPASATGNIYHAQCLGQLKLYGDFDVSVDFNHVIWPSNNGVRTAVAVWNGSGGFNLERTCLSTVGGEYVLADINGTTTSLAYAATNGKLRLMRTGATVTGFFWDGTAWQGIASWYSSIGPVNYCLWTWAHDYTFGHKDSLATFDNFRALDAGALIHGLVDLDRFIGREGHTLSFEIRQGSTVVDTQEIQVNGDGAYMMATGAMGTTAISVKGSHWLRKNSAPQFLIRDGRYVINLELVNGDVDGDNEIALSDYALLATAFGSAIGDANWNVEADLNGDDEINLADYAILASTFGSVGDD